MDKKPIEASEAIHTKVLDFIVQNFLFGDKGKSPKSTDSLIENGIVDSTGILELIQFLEDAFSIKISESETVPKNLDSIYNITVFVKKKTGPIN
jgi:acyl carrier protein